MKIFSYLVHKHKSSLLVLLLFQISFTAIASQTPIHNSIVKIFATQNRPDYASPWQKLGIQNVTGSGVIIADNRILTNAHVVADHTLVEVQREGSGITYHAEVAFVCHSCDLAVLSVSDPAFFKGAIPLQIDGLPKLQSRVNVYGFPTGGETISITQGIVSRIEIDHYVHSADRYLLVQVDAAINPGNSGGPAISNGKIIGIAMQALENAENIGYIVPAPIIEHFLTDIKDGRLDGFPELDIYVQLLQNPALRKSLKIPNDIGGLLVTAVARDSSVNNVIEPGDVILKIEGYTIDRDGKVKLNDDIRVESTHLEYLKQIGSTLKLNILRNGQRLDIGVTLSAKKVRANNRQYDIVPTYFVFGGLVFQPLTNGYLKSHHNSSYGLIPYIPEYTLEGYKKLIPDRVNTDRKQVIILSRLLPDTLNSGYKQMEGAVIHSVNNVPVTDLKHLVKLVSEAKGEFLEMVTDFGTNIVLDLQTAIKRNPIILQNYQVYSDRSADLQ